MATIGRLTVALAANSAQLAQDLQKSRKNVDTWSKQVERRAKQTAKVIAGIGVAATAAFAAAGAAGLLMINRQAAEIDAMYKQASNLRLDLGDFQRLGFIAEQSGNSVGELGSALNRMNMALAQETSLTVDALSGIGLSINQVMSMNPGDRFQAIAEAIRNTGDEAAQTRAQVALFGRAGGNMLNLINADFESLNAQFDRMGITLTNRQGDMVAAYQDAKNRLSTLFTGFKQQFTAQMAGPLTRIVEWIEEYSEKMGGMDVIAKRAAGGVVNALSFIIESGAGVLSFLNEALIKFKQLQLFDLEFKKRQVAIAGTLGFQVDESVFSEFLKLEREIEQMRNQGTNIDAQVDRMRELANQLLSTVGREIPNATGNAAGGLNNLGEEADGAAGRLAGLFSDMNGKDSAWNKIFGSSDENKGKVRDYVPEAFAKAARAFNDSLATGNMRTRETAMADMQRLIDVAAGRQGSTSFAGPDLQRTGDVIGMQSVLEKLQSLLPDQSEGGEPLSGEHLDSAVDRLIESNNHLFRDGWDRLVDEMSARDEVSVTLDLRTDVGALTGKVTGSREFSQAVQTLAAQAVNNTARGVLA